MVVVYPMKICQLQCETPVCDNYQSPFWSKIYQQELFIRLVIYTVSQAFACLCLLVMLFE